MNRVANIAICLLWVPFAAQVSRAQKPELVVQTGHSKTINSVAFSPDGKTLASGSEDWTIRLWDTATGLELRALTGHGNAVESVVFSSDQRTLASAGSDGTIILWDIYTGKQLRILTGHGNRLAITADGQTLVSGSTDTIKLWNVSTGAELRTLRRHAGNANSIAITGNGKILAGAGGSSDYAITLWDLSSGAELKTLRGHSQIVTSLAFTPDGKTLASGSEDSTVKLWDVSTGALLATLTGHSYGITSLAFSPDGTTLISGSLDHTVKRWDVSTGAVLRTLQGPSDRVTSVAFSPDRRTLASGSEDKTIRLWDVTTGAQLRTLNGYSNNVASVAFNPGGRMLASAGKDNMIRLWDLGRDAPPRTLTGHTDLVNCLAFSHDGKRLASGSDDKTVKLWDVSGAEPPRTLGAAQGISSAAFSPNGKTLAGSDLYTIKIWDVTTGAERRTLDPRDFQKIHSLAFSDDGQNLLSGSDDKVIRVWDVSSGRAIHTYSFTSGAQFVRISFSPDGKTAAVGDYNILIGRVSGTIELWNIADGGDSVALESEPFGIASIAFSTDGRLVAAGGWDGVSRVWERPTGKQLHALAGHVNTVSSLAFSPDGEMLASGSEDGTVKLWEVSTGRELATLLTFGQRDWLVVTPDGLFDGSPAAWDRMRWRFNNNTFNHTNVETFFGDFYYPGLLADIFAGKNPQATSNISEKDRRQPQLKLALTETIAKLATRYVTVKIDVAESAADKEHKAGSGAQDVRLFRNGLLAKVWRADVLKGQSSVTLEATVPIVAGENRLTAYAFNRDNIKSSDATLTVKGADSLKRPGTTYILAIGINKYINSQYDLKYAVDDAEDFSAEVKRQQELLKRYGQVKVSRLSDAEATKANIIRKLIELAARVQPEDAVIVYFAGHGTAQGNQFYLIPHDLGYDGPRENLSEAGLQKILSHSVSDRELEKLFEGIDAGQLLLVIDACNSGQALEAEEKRRGPMNSKGLAQLAYEKGMYVLTAAQSYQAAQEAAKFGHGFLTYALVEDGLKKGAADREPKDRTIDLREWLNYATEQVPRMQEENSLEALRGRGRYLVFVGDGSLSRDVGLKVDARDNIQRPRLFYRRELDANPLVVGRVGSPPRQ